MGPDRSQALVGRRYLLDRALGRGGMGVVYRAVDRLTGRAVALKQVGPDARAARGGAPLELSVDPSVEVRLSVTREFQTLASLRHPNVISVLDYGFDEDGQPYFTMELVQDARSILEEARGRPLAAQIHLIAQMLQALSYLHRQGIIHCDLKPANVLVADGRVRVLDFGISAPRERRFPPGGGGRIWGTLDYMAPETLTGAAPTEASDLYAVGVIAFEILAGRRPFERGDHFRFQHGTLCRPADAAAAGVPAALAAVLDRLLAKRPEDRYPSAQGALAAFNEAAGLPPAPETAAILDSFLKAARLVGRERELSVLLKALDEARSGRGGTWLVGGESGVGKSRLLGEVRTRALVSDVLVLEGQATREDRGPYQILRGALRWLCLLSPPTDHEASVLQGLVPDIAALLDRPVAAAPALDPESARSRLLATIEALVRRLQRPAVFLLEDLHWAGDESLAVLQRLQGVAAEMPLLIVASYRDDEAAALPRALPGAALLRLERLREESVAELSESMLGAAGRDPDLVRFLWRETEGNAFFLVEMVRALASQAGALEGIRTSGLPSHLTPGSVQRVLQRRLGQLPAEVRPLLDLAAVAGRELDLAVLARLAPADALDAWLARCVAAAVLEARAGGIHFAHDKLRQAVLAELSDAERRLLHGQVARAIEGAYPGAPERAAILAHHWGMAGQAEAEARYRVIAGEQALHIGAYRDAALSLSLALSRGAGRGDPTTTARLERELGEAYFGMGDMAESRRWLERAVARAGWPVPGRVPVMLARVIGLSAREAAAGSWWRWRGRRPRPRDPSLLEAARAYERLAHVYFFENQSLLVVYASLHAFSAARAAGAGPELARSCANLYVSVGLVPMRGPAQALGRLARRSAEEARDAPTLAWIDELDGVYLGGLGQWAAASARFEAALTAWRRLGHRRRTEETLMLFGMVLFHRGETAAADALRADLYEAGFTCDSRQTQAWALLSLAEEALRRGDASLAIDRLEAAAALQVGLRRVERIWCSGLLAQAYLRDGNAERAEDAASATMALIARSRHTAFYILDGYSGAAEVLLTMWERSGVSERRRRRRLARRAVRAMVSFARVFPMARPRALLWRGRCHWLEGRPERAQAAWRGALAAAAGLGMDHEAALVREEIGQRAGAAAGARADAADSARPPAYLEDLIAARGALVLSDESDEFDTRSTRRILPSAIVVGTSSSGAPAPSQSEASDSPTTREVRSETARAACMPDITVASTQPTLSPLSTQSPASARLVKPEPPAFKR